MENSNSFEYLDKIKSIIIDNLRHTIPAPSVQMQDVPRQGFGVMTEEEEAELDDLDEDENADVRMTERRWDQKVQNPAEYEDSDDEDMDAAHGKTKPRQAAKRNFTDSRKEEETAESGNATPANGSVVPDAPNAEPHEDADVTLDKSPEEEEAPAEKEAEGVTDKDGDVAMDDTAETTAPIKEEEIEAEPAQPEAASKPASRKASPTPAAATEEPEKAPEKVPEKTPEAAPEVKDDVAKDAPEPAEPAVSEDTKEASDKMDVDKPASPAAADTAEK